MLVAYHDTKLRKTRNIYVYAENGKVQQCSFSTSICACDILIPIVIVYISIVAIQIVLVQEIIDWHLCIRTAKIQLLQEIFPSRPIEIVCNI